MYFVYILRCIDGSTYTGCTSNLNARMIHHEKGDVKYTSSRLPFEIITLIQFTDEYKAFKFEKYLKSGSGRAFMNKRLV